MTLLISSKYYILAINLLKCNLHSHCVLHKLEVILLKPLTFNIEGTPW